jgi:menaquinone-9 beta-reductase
VAFDIIVVGGGPAGSAVGAILARKGCRVLILDRARFPRDKPCGDYLNPGCTAALNRIGMLDVVCPAAAPVPGMRIFAPDGASAHTVFSSGVGYTLSRRTLDHMLLSHAARAGATVHEESRVVALRRDGDAFTLTAEGDRVQDRARAYSGRIVIGADGLRSTVARLAGAGDPPRGGRYTVGGYVEGLRPFDPPRADPPGVSGEIHLGPNRYCGVAYLPDGVANVTIALSRGELRAWRGRLLPGYWAALRAFPGLGDRLTKAALVGRLRTSGPLGYCRRQAAIGRVLLAGDAAAFMDPMTGQGLYLAMRSAELAASTALGALDGGGSTRRILHGYDRLHRREFADAFLLSRALQCLAFRPPVVRRAMRRVAGAPEVGTRLIDAIGNVHAAASVLRPAFIARLLGFA